MPRRLAWALALLLGLVMLLVWAIGLVGCIWTGDWDLDNLMAKLLLTGIITVIPGFILTLVAAINLSDVLDLDG